MPEHWRPWLVYALLDGAGLSLILIGWVVLDDGTPKDVLGGLFSSELQVWVCAAGLAIMLVATVAFLAMRRRQP